MNKESQSECFGSGSAREESGAHSVNKVIRYLYFSNVESLRAESLLWYMEALFETAYRNDVLKVQNMYISTIHLKFYKIYNHES